MAEEKKVEEVKEEEKEKESAEGSEESTEGEEGSAKKKTNILLIVAIAVGVLLACVAGFVVLNIGDDKAEEEKAAELQVPVAPTFFEIPELIVSLSGNTSNIRYLKLVLSVELSKAEDLPFLEAQMPKITDEFQTYLRQLRLEDLRGSVGTYRLKEALLLRVNQVLQPVQASDVLIKEMLIQ